MIPSHRQRMPVKPKEISKAVLAMVNMAVISSLKIPWSPKKINFIVAVIKATIKNKSQMIFNKLKPDRLAAKSKQIP
jgi:hypothetical protein